MISIGNLCCINCIEGKVIDNSKNIEEYEGRCILSKKNKDYEKYYNRYIVDNEYCDIK